MAPGPAIVCFQTGSRVAASSSSIVSGNADAGKTAGNLNGTHLEELPKGGLTPQNFPEPK